MTAREHLQDLHKTLARHHTVKAAHHKAMSGHYVNLAGHLGKTESSKGARETLTAMAAAHEGMADEHAAMALTHNDAAEACAKATDVADLGKRENELQPLPEGFRRTVPSIPESGLRPGITAVPRVGSAPIQKPAVHPEFEKAFSLEDEETDLRGAPAI